MADMSNVDSSKILSTVNQLDGIVDSMVGQVRKILDAVDSLDKGWTSPVKADFLSRYQKDAQAMSEMLDQYGEISIQLKEIATEFDKNEEEITSSVSALR